VLYVEDSKVRRARDAAHAREVRLRCSPRRSVEDALALRRTARSQNEPPADLVLTDVYLKGGLTGKELLEKLRGELGYVAATCRCS
jgi:hypothetical protein